jgi:hypothetical protein
MRQPTRNLWVLGVSLLTALGLMGLTAVVAQAEGWLSTITQNLPAHADIHPLKENEIKNVVASVPSQKLELLCRELETKEGKLVADTSPPLATGTLNFQNCETFQKGKLNKGCKPKEPISMEVDIKLKLDKSTKLTYATVLPASGEIFTTLDFNEELCALPDTDIKGSIPVECLNEKLETMEEAAGNPDFCLEDMKHHLIQEVANHTLFPGTLLYGKSEMFISGIFDLFLDTENPFSGHI